MAYHSGNAAKSEARDDHPRLVEVPDRADRVDEHPAVGLVLPEEREGHADAEVEAVEHEVADEHEGDDPEPEHGEIHGVSS